MARQRYYPYGAVRPGGTGTLPTDYTFTGQKDVPGTGLMYYGARYYEPALGRFVSADTIVPEPGNPQDLNRYTYVRNNPLAYTDPTGHYVYEGEPCLGRGCNYDPTSTRYHFSTSGGSASADTYFLSPTESRNIFGTAVAQRVSQGTVGEINDPNNVAMLYVGIAASLTGGLAGLPMQSGFMQGGGVWHPEGQPPSGEGLWDTETRWDAAAREAQALKTVTNSRGDPYPSVPDPRTGRSITFPRNAQRMPQDLQVEWTMEDRAEFIAEWHARGYPEPVGGWEQYDIHHIRPRAFGGRNDFWNLVPVERNLHQNAR